METSLDKIGAQIIYKKILVEYFTSSFTNLRENCKENQNEKFFKIVCADCSLEHEAIPCCNNLEQYAPINRRSNLYINARILPLVEGNFLKSTREFFKFKIYHQLNLIAEVFQIREGNWIKKTTFLKSKKTISICIPKNYFKLSANKNRIIQSKDTLLIGME
jgi:hypothetical protein